MDLDIWRYCSRGRGEECDHKGFRLYSIHDLTRLALPEHWWYQLNEHGEGHAIQPPIKIKPILSWSPKKQIMEDNKLCKAPRLPIEKLCVDLLKRPCNMYNL